MTPRFPLRLRVSVAAAVVGIIVVLPAATLRAEQRLGATKVVFTVDVESNDKFGLPSQVDAVCSDGSRCGLMTIVSMLEKRGLAGTFFVNVYEHTRWRNPAMREIAHQLQAAGQDVALHTHPETAYDPARSEMYQYSLDEQTAIIRDGVQLLEAWTSRPIVAHRAGDYSANEDTLVALQRNGVRVDSSLFWEHPHSGLDVLNLPRNLPSRYRELLEIPVSSYQREERPRIFTADVDPFVSVRKIDINWLASRSEMHAAVDSFVAADVPVLVVFLHSFSFMTPGRLSRRPVADKAAMAMFQEVLDYVAEKHLPVVTMRDLAGPAGSHLVLGGTDVLPRIPVQSELSRYAWHRIRQSGPLSYEIGTALGIGGLLTAAALTVLARRRKPFGARVN